MSQQEEMGCHSMRRGQGAGDLLPASLQAMAVIIMCVESREWMKLGGKALPCLAASGVVLVPFMMRTFCSTVQIDWSSCASQRSSQARLAEGVGFRASLGPA